MTNEAGPNIVSGGLVFCIDAANTRSYSGSGTSVTDIGTAQLTGTLTNGVSFNSINNGTFVFDGNDDFIVTPTLGALSLFTVDVWVYATSLPIAGNYASFITDIYPNYVNFKIGYNGGGSGQVNAGIYSGTAWTYSSSSTLSVSTWTNFVMTYDGSNITLYKNNVGTSPVAFTGTRNTTGSGMRIGRRWDTADYFAGYIPSVKIYNRSLSTSELTQNYNALKGRYGL